jgi:hypothetical protein
VDLAHPFVAGHRAQMLEYRVFHHRLTPSSQACCPSIGASATFLEKKAPPMFWRLNRGCWTP